MIEEKEIKTMCNLQCYSNIIPLDSFHDVPAFAPMVFHLHSTALADWATEKRLGGCHNRPFVTRGTLELRDTKAAAAANGSRRV